MIGILAHEDSCLYFFHCQHCPLIPGVGGQIVFNSTYIDHVSLQSQFRHSFTLETLMSYLSGKSRYHQRGAFIVGWHVSEHQSDLYSSFLSLPSSHLPGYSDRVQHQEDPKPTSAVDDKPNIILR